MATHQYIRRQSQSRNLVNQLFNRETAFPVVNRSPYLWTRAFIDNSIESSETFWYKDLYGHFGCVNSVEFSPDGDYLASGGDDKRVLLWKVWDSVHDPNYEPVAMKSGHNSNIFCVAFDPKQKRLFSGGNDELVIVHCIETREAIDVVSHMDDIYGLSVDPFNNNIFASASNEIMIWDIRSASAKSTQLAVGPAPFHAVMYNPCDSNILVTANSKDGIDLYDIRKPMHKLFRFYSSSILNTQSAMCVRFNRAGNLILALRRRMSPVLYDIRSPYPLVEFESEDYYNSCTLKNCSFLGENDQFVASGSDNFKIYIWKIPDEIFNSSSIENPLNSNTIRHVPQAQQILNGHRSIVNQVSFNDKSGIIASTGVEKIIKLWSPIVQFSEGKNVNSRDKNLPKVRRNVFTYNEYLELVYSDRQYVPHDYSGNNTHEDTRMIAYFDSMIERDISSTWLTTSSDDDQDTPSYFSYIMHPDFAFNTNEDSVGSDDEVTLGEVTFHEISTDSDEKFSIQKRFDFSRNFEASKLDPDDHMVYIFAKRFHARYITSFVNNLISQIEKAHCDKDCNKESLIPETSDASSRKEFEAAENIDEIGSSSDLLNVSQMLNDQRSTTSSEESSLNSETINEKIKSKKETSLMFFAYKFSKALVLAFYFGTLYEKSKSKQHEENFKDETTQLVNSKQEIQSQIKKMSKLKGKNLCDKRLSSLLNALFKRVAHLVSLLNDSHYDIKAKCEEFIKNSKPTMRAQFFITNLLDSSNNSETDFDMEEEIEERANNLDESEEHHSSDAMSTLSSSTSLSTSDSSCDSSDDDSDTEQMESSQTKDEPCGDVPMISLNNAEAASEAATVTSDMNTPSTSKPSIHFKKIDRKNKSYKSPSTEKRRKKACKNKRQRKS